MNPRIPRFIVPRQMEDRVLLLARVECTTCHEDIVYGFYRPEERPEPLLEMCPFCAPEKTKT